MIMWFCTFEMQYDSNMGKMRCKSNEQQPESNMIHLKKEDVVALGHWHTIVVDSA